MEVAQWIEDEFSQIAFGDLRLDRRLKTCVAQFSRVRDSTPERCPGVAALKATYRFVDNKKVNMETILDQHNCSTQERCRGKQRVYQLQDTTEVDLTKPKQQVRGAGPLGTKNRRGFFYHPLYALDENGIPLGVLDQVVWSRADKSLEVSAQERKAERNRASFEEKESARWMEMLQSGEQIARSLPETEFVHVADSEADISELFCEAETFPENFYLIIRGGREHRITAANDVKTGVSLTGGTVAEALKLAEVRFDRVIEVGNRDEPTLPDDKKRSRKQARSTHQATLSVRTIRAKLEGPRRPGGGNLPNSTLNVVELLEENPPEGSEPIHWVLNTTMPIESVKQVEDVIQSYCHRWSIELFFKTLKSGMKIEDMKYETLPRYLVAFAMLSIVAWRVEYLKGAARKDADSSCEKYFTQDEWIAIVMFATHKLPDPGNPPTIGKFLIIVAQLGGYINKKSQGPPGSKTIWRGMRDFETITEAYRVFNPQTCGV